MIRSRIVECSPGGRNTLMDGGDPDGPETVYDRGVHLNPGKTSDVSALGIRLALVNGLLRETSADLYDDIAGRLRTRGIEVEMIHGLEVPISTFGDYDLLISNMDVPTAIRASVPTYAGRVMSRPTSLRLLEQFGVSTMDWTLARTRRDVRALFGTWGTERVLLKPSFTYGGKGVRVFTRSDVWRLHWRHDLDVLCREVNPNDGDVYKAELFNGCLLISWKSVAPPIRALFRGGMYRGVRGAYGERSLCELPSSLTAKLEAFSRALTADGLGHVSVDLMRRADDEFVAIELNPRGVATWWTRQFPHFRDRYTNALYEVAMQRRSPPPESKLTHTGQNGPADGDASRGLARRVRKKLLELAKQIVPKLSHVAVVGNSTSPENIRIFERDATPP